MVRMRTKITAAATALMLMAGCSTKNFEGVAASGAVLFESKTLIDTYIVAGQVFVAAAIRYAEAYSKASRATDVKDATVQSAIDRLIASQSGGFAQQMDAAENFAVTYGKSKAAKEIADRLQDAEFQDSLGQVLPLLVEAGVNLDDGDYLQGYATGSILFKTVQVFTTEDENVIRNQLLGSNLGLSFEELLQIPNRIRTAVENYEQSGQIADALEEIPNYDEAQDDLKAARGDYNDRQIADIEAAAQSMSEGGSYKLPASSGFGSGGEGLGTAPASEQSRAPRAPAPI